VLALFAFCIGSALWLLDLATGSRINLNKEARLQSTLAEVLANHPYDNNLTATKKTIYDDTNQQTRTVYTATLKERLSAIIISAQAPDGYAGQIDLLVGFMKLINMNYSNGP